MLLAFAIGACGASTQELPAIQAATSTTQSTSTTEATSTTTVLTTTASTTSTTTTTIPATTTDASAKEAHEVELARDLPRHRRDEIPIEGLTDEALRPILASPLPLILPETLPASYVWSLDAGRVFVSENASGEVIFYTYFLVTDGDGGHQIAVDVGAVTGDAEGPRLADYAPKAPEAGMAGGLVPYRLDDMESVRFIIEASDLAVTIELFRHCNREEDWTISEGICLTWEEVRQIITTMGVVES